MGGLLSPLPSDPLLPVLPHFLLPDGDDALDPVNGVLAGGERLTAVGGGHGDDYRNVADFEVADSVADGHLLDAPLRVDFGGHLRQLLLGHLFVVLVFEIAHALAAREAAHDA